VKLYSFFRSSAAYRVRIALNLKALDYEQVPVHFRKDGGQHRLPHFLALNPQGLLPVLDDDGFVLQQSLAIVEYLDEAYPDTLHLMPSDVRERSLVRAMAQMIACDLHPLNNLRVLNYLRVELDQTDEGVNAWYRHWVEENLVGLEEMVQRHGGQFCFGDEVSLADICLVPQMYNARRFSCDLTAFRELVAVDKRLRKLEPISAAAPELQPDAE
tara:strand:- start:3478 stop:4119 length:642 start_codon:yes stop_codon:yes gene_type:complete